MTKDGMIVALHNLLNKVSRLNGSFWKQSSAALTAALELMKNSEKLVNKDALTVKARKLRRFKTKGGDVYFKVDDIMKLLAETDTITVKDVPVESYAAFNEGREYKIPVEWRVYDTICVKAPSYKKAVDFMIENGDCFEFGYRGEYMPGSWSISARSAGTGDSKKIVEELEKYYGKDGKTLSVGITPERHMN